MEPKHVTINGAEFVIGRLDLFQALNVARLVAPAIPALFGGVLEGLMKAAQKEEKDQADAYGDLAMTLLAAQPLFNVIAAMRKEDFEAIISTCLSCVEKKRGNGYGPVIAEGVPMDDINVFDAIALSVHVIIREIRPFMNALDASSATKS